MVMAMADVAGEWWRSRAWTTRTGSWMASVVELWLVAEQDILVLCLSQVKMRIGRRFDTYRLFSDGFGTKRVRFDSWSVGVGFILALVET